MFRAIENRAHIENFSDVIGECQNLDGVTFFLLYRFL
jgi:hypothetical protein